MVLHPRQLVFFLTIKPFYLLNPQLFYPMRRRLNRPQALLLLLLWVVLCYLVLVSAARIDGLLILTLLISGALVFIPIYKSLKK